jgi:hypothetical protein
MTLIPFSVPSFGSFYILQKSGAHCKWSRKNIFPHSLPAFSDSFVEIAQNESFPAPGLAKYVQMR